MALNAADIPNLEFPRDEIIEVRQQVATVQTNVTDDKQIIPASYHNIAKRINIPGLPEHMLPNSPEMRQRSAGTSGTVSPMPHLGTPRQGTPKPSSGPLSIGKINVNPSS